MAAQMKLGIRNSNEVHVTAPGLLNSSSLGLRTVEEQVLQLVRLAIIKGDLSAGAVLKVEDLASSLGVSKTPVKQALKRLATEGFVQFSPYRSPVVAPLSADDAEEIYIMRMGLETLATRLGVDRLTPIALARLQDLCAQLDTLKDEPESFLSTDAEFHRTLYLCTRRESLVQRIAALYDASLRYIYLLMQARPNHLTSAQHAHHELLRACEEHDVQSASTIIAQSLQHSSDSIQRYLREERPPA